VSYIVSRIEISRSKYHIEPMVEDQTIESECPADQTFATVFADLESDLLYFAMKYVKSYEVAEDVVQDAFLKLYPLFSTVEKPRPWLYRTVYNLSLNHNRFQKKIVEFPANGREGNDGGKDTDRQHQQCSQKRWAFLH